MKLVINHGRCLLLMASFALFPEGTDCCVNGQWGSSCINLTVTDEPCNMQNKCFEVYVWVTKAFGNLKERKSLPLNKNDAV